MRLLASTIYSSRPSPLYYIRFGSLWFCWSIVYFLIHITRNISDCLFWMYFSAVRWSWLILVWSIQLLLIVLRYVPLQINFFHFHQTLFVCVFLSLFFLLFLLLFLSLFLVVFTIFLHQTYLYLFIIYTVFWICHLRILYDRLILSLVYRLLICFSHIMFTIKMMPDCWTLCNCRLWSDFFCFLTLFISLFFLSFLTLLRILSDKFFSLFLHHLHSNWTIFLCIDLLSCLYNFIIFFHLLFILQRKNSLKTS